jgi:hypothetical protein
VKRVATSHTLVGDDTAEPWIWHGEAYIGRGEEGTALVRPLESRPNYDLSLTTRREGASSMACDNFGGSSHE